jgi:hypothetical protein
VLRDPNGGFYYMSPKPKTELEDSTKKMFENAKFKQKKAKGFLSHIFDIQ